MIVDSSALMAIVLKEPDGDVYLRALSKTRNRKISAATWVEVHMVVDNPNQNQAAKVRFEHLMDRLKFEVVAVDADTTWAARRANQDNGRGRHPARLNFGDCFSYALAKQTGEPLLFKGNDFSQTDVVSALP